MNLLSFFKGVALILALLVLHPSYTEAQPTQHPGCAGKNNNICDTLGMMINMRSYGCFRVMDVEALTSDRYHVTCELASYDRSEVTYDLRFQNNRRSYSVTPL